MSILLLPNELLLLIAAQLDCKDLNCLYRWNLERHGFAALIGAAKTGSIRTLQRFPDIGVDIGWQSRYRANMSRSVSGLKPRHRAIPIENSKPDHPICHAATYGQAEFLRKLIDHGADVNFKGSYGRSPLALAARQGNFALVQMLVSLGANQLSYDKFRHRPASNAAAEGHHRVADFLLQELGKHPVKLNHTIMMEMQWMLLYAAKEGNKKRIHLFLSRGADINFQPRGELYTCTALCGALLSAPQPLKIVELLLSRGADPNIALRPRKPRSGGRKPPPSPPLSLAILRDESLQLIKLLLKAGADARQCGLALFDAIRLEKATECRVLVDHHADLYVCFKGRSIAECARESDCQSIREACAMLDMTAPTRELGKFMRWCCLLLAPAGRVSFRMTPF